VRFPPEAGSIAPDRLTRSTARRRIRVTGRTAMQRFTGPRVHRLRNVGGLTKTPIHGRSRPEGLRRQRAPNEWKGPASRCWPAPTFRA
jgi:hypothetical protein